MKAMKSAIVSLAASANILLYSNDSCCCSAFAPPHQQLYTRRHSMTTMAHSTITADDTAATATATATATTPAPSITTTMNDAGIENFMLPVPVPRVGEIMKMLPKDSFQVSTSTSLMYFGIDVLAVIASMGFLDMVVTSSTYQSLPIYQQAMAVVPLQVLTGFAMWCTWCIGHDAGHGTVSKSSKYGAVINRIVGEITHSMICLTPYVPWQMSHRKHHLNHNHLEKDYSHQWYIREEREEFHPLMEVLHSTRMLFLPFLYMSYLVTGIPDGGHVFFYGRMWEGHSMKEKLDGSISVAVAFATAGTLWHNMGTSDFAVVCMVPWMVMAFWLFMVTYLQHHSEDGKLYTDDTFTFEKGAFETVDRDYGKWINRMSHHMMDGHVVHHLLFTKVPHYKLEAATLALQEGLKERGQEDLYKRIDTPNYTQEIVKQYYTNWFFVNESQIVRE